ncbi:type 1 fimbrial protein [Burkholderia cenocepacia]|uniref:fimbrial protein n=1 Tax=Burkholderia cenocepacia TaxID=95486 RepID=UPI001B90357C|nr:fimbrial protein [Burkholderia cenocepacia]MBR8068309.1 type 1 fimbrial protein [Burkholderia cenocepacia]MBR8446044.1 type 1 fimbrial protein [Burkholderia cenocepacia]
MQRALRSAAQVTVSGIMLLTAFGTAHACQLAGSGTTLAPSYPPTITSVRDAQQPGAIVASYASNEAQGFYLYNCAGTGKVEKVGVKATGTPLSNVAYDYGGRSFPVYETGVPGIGFALLAVPGSDNYPPASANWKAVRPEETLVSTNANQITFFYIVTYRTALVFTGSLATGTYTIPKRLVATTTAYAPGGAVAFSGTTYLQPMTISVTAKGCTLTSGKQMNVKLPQLVGQKLQTVGAVSDEAARVTLNLNCDGTVNVYTTLTDAANPANEGTILNALPGSTSSGIGLQIYKQGSGTPINFGPDSAVKGNKNQWLAGRVTNGSLSIPLEARYVKTAPTFKPGSLEASATVTFSYQ